MNKISSKWQAFRHQLAQVEADIGEPLPEGTQLWRENLKAAIPLIVVAVISVIGWYLFRR